jgi:hypothetical protein
MLAEELWRVNDGYRQREGIREFARYTPPRVVLKKRLEVIENKEWDWVK